MYMPTYVSTVLVNIPDSSAQSLGKDNTVQQQQIGQQWPAQQPIFTAKTDKSVVILMNVEN